MKQLFFITILFAGFACNMEYKHSENDVQGYNWLGVTGTEEIRNDTLFSYRGKLGSSHFDWRIIQNVTDSTILYQYFDKEKDELLEYNATYRQMEQNGIPYLVVYHKESVSMFTRKRVCPINFGKIFK